MKKKITKSEHMVNELLNGEGKCVFTVIIQPDNIPPEECQRNFDYFTNLGFKLNLITGNYEKSGD